MHQWESSGKSAPPFGYNVKLVEVITPNNMSGKVNRTVRVNSHRIRFQDSIIMAELQVIHNLNGKVSWGPVNYT